MRVPRLFSCSHWLLCYFGELFSGIQRFYLTFLFFSFVILCVAIAHAWLLRWRKPHSSGLNQPIPPALIALGKLALIMVYFYVCDRTNLFMKESKYYSRYTFWIPVVYVFCVGLFFTEESRSTKVLHKDQTDEWKGEIPFLKKSRITQIFVGWMQVVVLIYHWTDSVQVLPLYMAIRVIASTYIFLTGYGHFSYFWHKGDASITRFFQVSINLTAETD